MVTIIHKNTFIEVTPYQSCPPLRRTNSVPKDMKLAAKDDELMDLSTEWGDWSNSAEDFSAGDFTVGNSVTEEAPHTVWADEVPGCEMRAEAPEWVPFAQPAPPPPPVIAPGSTVRYCNEEVQTYCAKSSGVLWLLEMIRVLCLTWSTSLKVELQGDGSVVVGVALTSTKDAWKRVVLLRQMLEEGSQNGISGPISTDLEQLSLKVKVIEALADAESESLCYDWQKQGTCTWQWCKWRHPKVVSVRVHVI